MNSGKYVFYQLLEFVGRYEFNKPRLRIRENYTYKLLI